MCTGYPKGKEKRIFFDRSGFLIDGLDFFLFGFLGGFFAMPIDDFDGIGFFSFIVRFLNA